MKSYLPTLILISIISIVLFPNCGTIMHGTTQQIKIASSPENAKVFLNQLEAGKTPILLDLSRKENHIIRLELENYEPEIISITRKNSNWFLGNCLIGGIIGMAIDAISGGMYILEPEEVSSILKEESSVTHLDDGQVLIKVVMNVDPTWEKIGQLKKISASD